MTVSHHWNVSWRDKKIFAVSIVGSQVSWTKICTCLVTFFLSIQSAIISIFRQIESILVHARTIVHLEIKMGINHLNLYSNSEIYIDTGSSSNRRLVNRVIHIHTEILQNNLQTAILPSGWFKKLNKWLKRKQIQEPRKAATAVPRFDKCLLEKSSKQNMIN